jgi:gliding motility-associated-like protein
MLFRILSFIFLCYQYSGVFSQSESNYWYFGNKAGLKFNTLPPVAVTDGQINSYGGSATISDNAGNLLFYTDGVKIWAKNHTVMPNGSGLMGNYYATQSALIVPRPASTSIYYVFTVDSLAGANGLRYSKVNMLLNGGFGDVETSEKNIPLLSPVTEKLTAVRHFNNTDFWVITHQWNSNKFYSYKVTGTGVNTTPVISNTGITHGGITTNAQGYMKASPDGTRIALATAQNNTIEIFNFNSTNGIVSSPVTISNFINIPYGIEFSPDASKLYVSTEHNIYQFNLQSGNIPGSVVNIATCDTISLGALQIALDGKIYCARKLRKFLGVINNPNATGTFCNYTDNIISLNNKLCRIGLPNFIQSFFNVPRFNFDNTCYGDATVFNISDTSNVNFVLWNFDDPASGTQNISNLTGPSHVFTAPGTYDVQLVLNYGSYSDTVAEQVTINPLPVINLGPPTAELCPGTDTILNAGEGFAEYLWQNGSSSPTFFVTTAGLYSVTVTDENGCMNSDNIMITTLYPPVISLGNDTFTCEGVSLQISAWYPGAEYEWSTGATTSAISIQNPGTYTVTVSNRCGSVSDDIAVSVIPSLSVDITGPTDVCSGDSTVLDAGLQPNYLWSNGATTQTITVNTGGTYSVDVFYSNNQCPHAGDEVTVNILDLPYVELPPDTTVCSGNSVSVTPAGLFIINYLWSTGEVTSSISVSMPGTYYLTVSNECSIELGLNITDSFTLNTNPVPFLTITPDDTVFEDESIQLTVTINSSWTYIWAPVTGLSNPAISNPVATPPVSTTYNVTVTDTLGCTSMASVMITVIEPPLDTLHVFNTFTPNGDNVNDTWYIENIEEYPDCEIEIYNRNGNLVYKKKNYQNDWDGKYNGHNLPAATYFFILKPGSGKDVIKGDVTIIR